MKVKDICDLHNGRAFKPGDWGSEGLPIIRIQNLNDEKAPFNYFSGEHSPVHEINDGDLLFSWSGTPGTSFGAFRWRRGKGVLNQHIFKILPKIEVDKEYLKYALNGNINTIIAKAHGGVGLQHITKKELDEIDIPIIALPDQLKAVDRISSAEKMIAMRKLELQKLDELVKARFVEQFSGTFEVVSAEDVCSDIVDCPHSTPKYDEKELIYPAIRTSEIQNGSILWDSMKYVGVVEYENRVKRLKPERGDVVYAREGTYGDCVILPDEYKFCLGQRTMLFRPDYKICTSAYLHAVLRSDAVKKQADESNAGSTVPHVNVADAKKFHFPLPPLELQQQFAAFVEQVDKSKGAVQKALDEAQLLFDSLMQEYFG